MLLFFIFLISGCAPSLDHYEPIYESLHQGEYEEVIRILEEAREENRYEYKDRVLYSLEKGLALHYAGLFERSNERFALADEYITELYTRRISEVGFSFLTNDNDLPYPGEPYEDIYLNVFKALNFAALRDPQAVFVEVRKLDEKLSYMERRFRDLAESYSSGAAGELGEDIDMEAAREEKDFQPEQTQFHSSALGRYLGFITRLQLGEKDGARIDLENMQQAFLNQPAIYNFDFPELPSLNEPPRGQTRVHFLAALGKGPEKYQVEDRISYKDLYITIAYPRLQKRGTSITKVEILKNGNTAATLEKLEDVNLVAENVFQLHQPLIHAKALVRGIGKALISREARAQTDNPFLQLFILGLQEATEQADLRTTRLLPGEFHVGYHTVPTGEEITYTARYYADGSLIKSETITKTFSRNDLNLVRLQSFK